MGKSTTPPPAPNYTQAATDQKAENLVATHQNAVLNNPNIQTPTYIQSTTWDDQWQPTVRLQVTPTEEQTIAQNQQAQLGLSQLANDQTKNISGILSNPFSFNGSPQTSIGNAGAVNQNGVNAPNLQTNLGNAGPINGGPSAGQYGLAGGPSPAPQLQQQLDESGVARAPINAGTTAQQAIMARLQPQIARNRTSAETQLTNQGLRPGAEAYDNAVRDLGQQENDLYSQAALQGLNLDLAANQQGFGQAQARGEFGNNAALNQYNAGLQGTNQWNQAIGQNFSQGLAAQQAQNQAQQQGFNQQVQGGQFGNDAQLASFGAGLQNQQAQNQAQQQQFNQNLQQGQFGNTALAQALSQQMQIRNSPINEISALLSGSQVQAPQMSPYAQATGAPAPLFQGAQLQDQYNQNLYNQQVAQNNSGLSGLFGLGGSLLGGPIGGAIGKGIGGLFR